MAFDWAAVVRPFRMTKLRMDRAVSRSSCEPLFDNGAGYFKCHFFNKLVTC